MIIKQIANSFSFLIIIYNGVRRSQFPSPAKDKKNVIDKEAYSQSLVRRFNKEAKIQSRRKANRTGRIRGNVKTTISFEITKTSFSS